MSEQETAEQKARRKKLGAAANAMQAVMIAHRLSGNEAIEVCCLIAACQTVGGDQDPAETMLMLNDKLSQLMEEAAKHGHLPGVTAIIMPGAGGDA